MRRISKSGKAYSEGSTGGWGGWDGPRVCFVCGGKVLASDPATMLTNVVTGVKSTRHNECKAAG